MSIKTKSLLRLRLHYDAYKVLRKAGLDHETALARMDYLHPITLAQLKKFIEELCPKGA